MKRARPESLMPKHRPKESITYCEFYAGIGGWTMALQEALKSLSNSVVPECRVALDHSDLCKSVYEHNKFGPCKTRRIERIPVESPMFSEPLDIWLLSPPCQPHTRQHENQEADMEDARSASFLHLCRMIHELKEENLPSMILLENVVGFEESSSCFKWREALAGRDYRLSHFVLQPTQVGLPNDRPRYYCIAVRGTKTMESPNREDTMPDESPDPLDANYFQSEKDLLIGKGHDSGGVSKSLKIHTSLPELDICSVSEASPLPLAEFLDKIPDDALVLPEKVWSKQASWCMDIVNSESKRTACFTSGYGKFVRGTGSVLYSGDAKREFLEKPEDRQFLTDWASGLNRTDLRYFSGTELTRLFGFDSRFSFPPTTTHKQQWKLIGNSLNVRVASKLVELGLRVLWKH